ncbi:hypothetical protein [Streptomyces sp. 11x1]|uniref:hypothetical protein n=1 Tax=Streptomyces sp. 11x1 TaxID=3038642 RepID=UPI002930C4B1|nr:hypothetical protein [Streptomyces sp. 11x1]WNZ14038.1 hypothetical protein P8T65_45100 [Streptomyces sp. 11x1]
MSRTFSALVTSGADLLGVTGPFPVDVPWWAEVKPVVERLERALGVAVYVVRLLRVDGGEGGRDGHVTYHVEALEPPAPGSPALRPADRGTRALLETDNACAPRGHAQTGCVNCSAGPRGPWPRWGGR